MRNTFPCVKWKILGDFACVFEKFTKQLSSDYIYVFLCTHQAMS